MLIAVGQALPSASVLHVTEHAFTPVEIRSLFAGQRVVLVTLIGAFTDVCSEQHLPGFIQRRAQFADKGVDRVACLSVNDGFVLQAWLRQVRVPEQITLLGDGAAELTHALGIAVEIPYMGVRCGRGVLLIEDGVVKRVDMEPPRAFGVSSAEACLSRL